MRFSLYFSPVVATVFALGFMVSADAAPRQQDHVYADSFGNLVIDSAAGYKRILVGEGHMAKKLASYTSGNEPEVIHFNDHVEAGPTQDCYRPPVLVKGRSYMYGLSDGEMPQLSPCR